MSMARAISYALLLASLAVSVNGNSRYIRAPCIFSREDAEMHKYAAVVAATEPFRESCQTHILQAVSPLRRLSLWLGGGSIIRRADSIREKNDAVDVALSRYETRVGEALKAYDLEPEEFNEISKLVNSDATLRQKVNLQSYYYKIAADLQSNLNNGLPELPKVNKPSALENIKATVLAPLTGPPTTALDADVQLLTPMQRFARSVAAVEAERLAMREALTTELKLKELPAGMSDPALQSAFCPQIRRLAAALPRIAQEIVARNGLDDEQFEDLQRKAERNPLFRWQVQREIRRLES